MMTEALRVEEIRQQVAGLPTLERISALKQATLAEERFISVEQARIITASYRNTVGRPQIIRRAQALYDSLTQMPIRIDPGELVVGNRTPGIRSGVVFPEGGITWVAAELESLPTRPQDPFSVRPEDAGLFLEEILPAWKGSTLEEIVADRHGKEIAAVKSVVKINQTDHAQGHISPHVERWLSWGPMGIRKAAAARGADDFHRAVELVMDGSIAFIQRYSERARELVSAVGYNPAELREIAAVCDSLATRPPQSFREAVQAVWFLFVVLQMESNASSFSPGRMDQYLYPYLTRDLEAGRIPLVEAQELLEALWLKFNQIVYLRSASSAQYFAGFPIGFNVAIGGMDRKGADATNILSFMILKAQEHIGLPQPNLSARLWSGSPEAFVDQCARVIGRGSGMPQIVNDESIIPALESQGISQGDARDYAVVGCVELSTQGNNLGWSDAAMFNLVKVLELAINDGVCMLTGKQLGPKTGLLSDFSTMDDFLSAFRQQFDYFVDRMIPLCDAVDRLHAEVLPSPFLSGVIEGCLEKGIDVTAGGAVYNFSGIQAIQVANLADSLAVLAQEVFGEGSKAAASSRSTSSAQPLGAITADRLLRALRSDFDGEEPLRQHLIQAVPKYGNDVEWVDHLGASWARYFSHRLKGFTNARGGPYHMGLYTVSAHVPMGKNVAATPDGRHAREPLADGGVSAMYGRDIAGPTALLASVARVDSVRASNGTLLNMKFLPRTFEVAEERAKFVALLRAVVKLKIHHVQFNVVDKQTLLNAQAHPDQYRSLTIRVAGYTAYFTELAPDLQEEIISRTSYGDTE